MSSSRFSDRIQVGDVIRLRFESEGISQDALEGGKEVLAWRQTLTLPGASYIAPHFSTFVLPPGARLVVRSPEGDRSWTYTRFGKGEGFQVDKSMQFTTRIGDK